MPGKRRKAGDWKTVVATRLHRERTLRTTRGQTNVPPVSDVGSAAYRRLASKVVRRHGE